MTDDLARFSVGEPYDLADAEERKINSGCVGEINGLLCTRKGSHRARSSRSRHWDSLRRGGRDDIRPVTSALCDNRAPQTGTLTKEPVTKTQIGPGRQAQNGEGSARTKKRKPGSEAADDVSAFKEEDKLSSNDEDTQGGSAGSTASDRLLALYREKDSHRKRCEDLQRRITRDEEDVGRLLMMASQCREAASQRAELAKRVRDQKEEEERLYEETNKLIQELHRELDSRGDLIR